MDRILPDFVAYRDSERVRIKFKYRSSNCAATGKSPINAPLHWAQLKMI
jgi:hypothetical protein